MTVTAAASFARFLADKLSIAEDELEFSGEWGGAGNTIGALALRLNLLDLIQIDEILERQENSRQLFGEIAVELGFLSTEAVERLVELQQYHQYLEILERLVIRGKIAMPEMQRLLLEFFESSVPVA